MTRWALTALVLASAFATRQAHAQPALAEYEGTPHWVAGLDAGGSLLSLVTTGNATRTLTTHEGAFVGWRSGGWGLLLRVEHALWRIAEGDRNRTQHALDIAGGVEHFHASGRLRFALYAGSATLLRSNRLDAPGQTGVFLDVRPIGLFFELRGRWRLGVDPLHFAVVAPTLSGVPLVEVQFRSSVLLECWLGRRNAASAN
ncbi:MAG: hypothetical protein AAF447_04870 [Myxococcota bacterium]